MTDDQDASSAIRQKLMTADEVYVYKIPPLKDAGGHRAEDWNLSTPLKTCHLLVERRGDALVLEFTTSENKKLFCQSQVDPGQKVEHCVEQVVDSSRYFVVKIQGGEGGREALVGFGFRDREQATDLRESLQHYQKSIRREKEASAKSGGSSFSIPKMEAGEKIHVNRTGKSTITKQKEGSTASSKGRGAIPLLKKPPASPTEQPVKPKMSKKEIEKIQMDMDGIDLNASSKEQNANDSDDDSDGAVYEGDEEQWATEFAMK